MNCLATGFLGTSILMDTLTDLGEAETAYSLLLSHGYPSWLYSVDQGATTVWERWNSYTLKDGFGPVGMNSFNHYAYGAIVNWMFRTMAGIGQLPQESGFRKFLLAPIPDRRMGHVTATYRTPHGVIRSAWRYDESGTWTWNYEIPAGTTADVTLPGEKTSRRYGPGKYEIRGYGCSFGGLSLGDL